MSEAVRKAPRWAWWVATGLGSGRLRPAPGTWGSLAGLAAWCGLALGLTAWPMLPSPVVEAAFLLALGLLTWAAILASDRVAQETGTEDPSFIVADEWVGMWITLWPLRWELRQLLAPDGWRWVLVLAVPFLVFRLLDIWKPWPVHQIQDLPGGQGIVADDLVAGLYGLPVVLLLMPWLLGR